MRAPEGVPAVSPHRLVRKVGSDQDGVAVDGHVPAGQRDVPFDERPLGKLLGPSGPLLSGEDDHGEPGRVPPRVPAHEGKKRNLVHKAIAKTINENPDRFSQLNSGFLIGASKIQPSNYLMGIYLFEEGYHKTDFGRGAAISVLMLLCVAALSVVYVRKMVKMGDET